MVLHAFDNIVIVPQKPHPFKEKEEDPQKDAPRAAVSEKEGEGGAGKAAYTLLNHTCYFFVKPLSQAADTFVDVLK